MIRMNLTDFEQLRSKVYQNLRILKLREFNDKERSLCLITLSSLAFKIIAV